MKPAGSRSRWRRWRWLMVVAVVLAAYPAVVFGVVYSHTLGSGLPGGRNGPADAYRHSLASAVVAYTLSPRCVALVTHLMERDGQGGQGRAMDAHNNRIGARIGATTLSWTAMQTAVRDAVESGAIDAPSADQITWLAPDAWQDRLY